MKTKPLFALALSVLSLAATVRAGEKFVAHEWGTFTSVQGADGIPLEWNPLIRTDLPRFVYSRALPLAYARSLPSQENLGKSVPSFVRMETPVIYFYSDTERTADVTVTMPQGRITEWYPRATAIGPYFSTNKAESRANRSFIEWKGVTILPGGTREISADKLIREPGGNHYYEARETDANFVRVPSPHEPRGVEYERDLFYRGVGFFPGPLVLKLSPGENDLQLTTKNSEPFTDLFVLTIRQGLARYQRLDRLTAAESKSVKLDHAAFAPLKEVRARIMREMSSALAQQGLYAREAEAMVNTWQDQWFTEEGTRVLYLLPRAWTDQTLPLSIVPAPHQTVRVMVGRAELITPTMELALRQQVARYGTGPETAKKAAVAAVRELGLGRFLEPATRKMLGQSPPREFALAAWALAQEASKTVEGKGPAVTGNDPAEPGPKTAALAGGLLPANKAGGF